MQVGTWRGRGRRRRAGGGCWRPGRRRHAGWSWNRGPRTPPAEPTRGAELRDSGSLGRSPHLTAADTGNAPLALRGPPPAGWRLRLPLLESRRLWDPEAGAGWRFLLHLCLGALTCPRAQTVSWPGQKIMFITDCDRAPCWILPRIVALVLRKEPDTLLTVSVRQISSEEVSLHLIFTFRLSPGGGGGGGECVPCMSWDEPE
uniref:Uncharacterized protein n=1 Tax=Myotis myotis TaxID=51298 RepID=A0A7J7TTQ8_MYOMY|nr:hypothetical protein mMyoMyo1_008950 [Myotis myotis]